MHIYTYKAIGYIIAIAHIMFANINCIKYSQKAYVLSIGKSLYCMYI